MKRINLMNQSRIMLMNTNLKRIILMFGSTSPSHDARAEASKDSVAAAASIFPYTDEPIPDPEWVQRYEKEKEKLHAEALQQRLDSTVAASQW